MTPPRILIEDGDGAMSWAIEAVLSRRGYVVDSCAGPAWLDDGCPLVAGGTCQKVEDADAVFFALGADDREVLDATRERFPELPVVIQAFPSELVELGRLADGCETVTPAATGHGIATAVAWALMRADGP